MKQEHQMVTYAAGPVNIIVKAKVRNVKVIPNEECVPKHKLLVKDMWFNTTKRWCKKSVIKVHVWKLKEEKTCEEYQSMVKDKVAESIKSLCEKTANKSQGGCEWTTITYFMVDQSKPFFHYLVQECL